MAKSAKLPIYAQLIACLRQGRSKPRHFWGNTLSRSLQVELLEKRQLLDASALSSSHVSPDEQIVFLNFDGAQDVLYRGPIEIDGISIASFHEGMPKSIDAHQIVAEIVAELNAAPNMVNQGVHFTTRRPQLAPYSTVYVGAENKQFHKFGSFFGVAERVDIGNQTRTDNAFVFSDKIAASFGSSQATLTNALIHVIDHEVQHLLGFSHEFNVGGVLDEVAYSQDVHQWIAQQGYAYFEKQFGYSSLTDNLHWFVDGADDEDDAGLNPFGHGGVNHPSVRHFWDHDAAFSRTFNDGLLGFDSAPNRAIKYITGGFGLTGIFDTDWGSGPSRPGAGLASLGAASSYAADPATAFYYLGHAAHLLQDMAVPAHVHSDQHLELGGAGLNPDPYHDWVDGAEFSSSVFQNPARIAAFDNIDPDRWTNYALPDEVDTTSMRTASDILAGFIPGSVSPDVRPLYQLFLDTAGLSDNYDSRNANGEIDRGGRGDTGSVFDNNYNNWTRAELEEIARVLVPRSIRDMGDLVRYFYAVVDSGDSGKPQVEQVAIDNLSDADPQQPHGPSNPKLSSDATIILRTAASDDNNGKSGIGKDLFQFEFRTKPPGGAWTDWQSPADETNWPGYTSSNGLALNSSHFQDGANISSLFGGQAGAVAAPVFRGQFGYSYGFRVLAEDGAGNQQMSEERYVKIERDSGVNVIEVIDRSSSMSGEKIEAAKQAASLFVNLMDQGDRIGIVSYSSAARVDYALNEILADGSIQQAANSAIAAIDSSGNTAIGKGILAADTQLDALDPGASRAMIVLTDG
ncbi:MAG: VWA domain-containing protein, partial [Planctomycetales bacterium]|nr:VWA domain-containing protein [Planctomycetales bacterium]